MPARDHHSIGEVLSLLQDDFPDITISKIRFLESQGLINPERTPSGYRRFFERDLQRLRWILTQQRDHYLPLKVIREKLAAGEADDLAPVTEPAPEPEATATAPADEAPVVEPGPAAASEPAAAAEPVTGTEPLVEAEVAAEVEPAGETAPPASPQATVDLDEAPLLVEPRDELSTPDTGKGVGEDRRDASADATEVPTPTSDDAFGGEGLFGADARLDDAPPSTDEAVEVLEASEAVGAREPGEPTGVADEAATPQPDEQANDADDGTTSTEAPAADGAGTPTSGASRRTAGKAKGRRAAGSKAKAASAVDEPAAPATDAAEAGPVDDDRHDAASPDDGGTDERPGRAPAATASPPPAEPQVVALTRDELAEASGCSVAVLSDLERFGLLQGKTVGRGVLYDGDALVVARLAARFANHGLEPRHLRSFRLAAEREIGLFAQVVGPLLQRRDAMAHERAMETLTDLAELASDLHEVLVQNLVSREFGNR